MRVSLARTVVTCTVLSFVVGCSMPSISAPWKKLSFRSKKPSDSSSSSVASAPGAPAFNSATAAAPQVSMGAVQTSGNMPVYPGTTYPVTPYPATATPSAVAANPPAYPAYPAYPAEPAAGQYNPAAGQPAKPNDPYKGMSPKRIVIAHDQQPGCEPKCADWISAEGDIVPETANELHRVLKRLGARKLPLFMSSPGGSIEAALAMGREIRAHKLDVAVVRTYFAPCEPGSKTCKNGTPTDGAPATADSGTAFCASSCTFVLASGTRRVAPANSHVGVHQITGFQTFVRVKRIYRVMRQIRNGVPVEISRHLISERPVSRKTVQAEITDKSYKPIVAFFKDMGISDDIVPLMVSAANSDIHWMTQAELAQTHLTTDEMGGEALLYEGKETSVTIAMLESAEFKARRLRRQSVVRRASETYFQCSNPQCLLAQLWPERLPELPRFDDRADQFVCPSCGGSLIVGDRRSAASQLIVFLDGEEQLRLLLEEGDRVGL